MKLEIFGECSPIVALALAIELGLRVLGSYATDLTVPPFENHLKIHRHFYRAHACFVKYFLMTEKFQHIRKLA